MACGRPRVRCWYEGSAWARGMAPSAAVRRLRVAGRRRQEPARRKRKAKAKGRKAKAAADGSAAGNVVRYGEQISHRNVRLPDERPRLRADGGAAGAGGV